MPRGQVPTRAVAALAPVRGNVTRLQPGGNPYLARLLQPDGPGILDLFCGAGGMSLGFALAGFRVLGGIDADAWAMETHAYNFGGNDKPILLTPDHAPDQVLHELGIDRVDVLVGGPPCQGFARVGRGKLRSLVRMKLGEDEVVEWDDPRNQLYRAYLRFVHVLRPSFLVMENVPDMARYDGGAVVGDILRDLEAEGYRAEWRVLHATQYGVPQTRSRLFIIANNTNQPIVWPEPTARPVSLRQAIGDLPRVTPDLSGDELPYTGMPRTAYARLMRRWLTGRDRRIVHDHVVRQYAPDDQEAFRLLEEGQRYTDLPLHLRRYRSDIFDDKYHKLHWDKPSWTVTAHIARDGYKYIHPDKDQLRTITVREAARIQSFPDWFRFAGFRSNRLRQIGNAVPPLMAQAIAGVVLQQLAAAGLA